LEEPGAWDLELREPSDKRRNVGQASRLPWTGETPVLLSRRPPESHGPVVAGGSKRLAVVREGKVHAEPIVSLQRGHLAARGDVAELDLGRGVKSRQRVPVWRYGQVTYRGAGQLKSPGDLPRGDVEGDDVMKTVPEQGVAAR